MKFSIIISPNDKNSKAMEHACRYIQSLLIQNQQVTSVFVYGIAIKLVLKNNLPNQDLWSHFAQSGIKLFVCSTLVENLLPNNKLLHPCFTEAGLGQWMESIHDSDKHIEFI